MGRVELENLAKIGHLYEEAFEPTEYANLVASGRARLADAKRIDLAFASRFDLAYNAAHSLALAALRQAGYRCINRVTVFSCLVHTLQLSTATCRLLVRGHGLRNAAEYEGEGELDERFIDEFIDAAQVLSDAVPDAPLV